jgi:hypothetical protein
MTIVKEVSMNRDEKRQRAPATEPSREKAEQPKKLRLEQLETRVAPNAIWGD